MDLHIVVYSELTRRDNVLLSVTCITYLLFYIYLQPLI